METQELKKQGRKSVVDKILADAPIGSFTAQALAKFASDIDHELL